ncbi:MAG: hypothetical protein WAN66_27530 [Limnoraphis robusta]
MTQQNYSKIPVIDITKWRCKTDSKVSHSLNTPNNILSIQLQNQFDGLIYQDPVLSQIISFLQSRSIKAVIFGGWVRDNIINYFDKTQLIARDIDIVLGELEPSQIQALLNIQKETNIFGGCSIKTARNKIDIWQLKDTFLIKKKSLPILFETLPKTTVFRINSIVFKPQQLWQEPQIIDFGCFSALENKILDFQSNIIPFPEIQVARALIYSIKLQLQISIEVIDFIKNICHTEDSVFRVRQGLALNCPETLSQDVQSLFNNFIA